VVDGDVGAVDDAFVFWVEAFFVGDVEERVGGGGVGEVEGAEVGAGLEGGGFGGEICLLFWFVHDIIYREIFILRTIQITIANSIIS
jgi:hypothetical protein